MSLADFLKQVDTSARTASATSKPLTENRRDENNDYRDGLARALEEPASREKARPSQADASQGPQQRETAPPKKPETSTQPANQPPQKQPAPPPRAEAENRRQDINVSRPGERSAQAPDNIQNPIAQAAIQLLGRENETIPAALELPLPPAALQQLVSKFVEANKTDEPAPEIDELVEEASLLPPESLAELLHQIRNAANIEAQVPHVVLPAEGGDGANPVDETDGQASAEQTAPTGETSGVTVVDQDLPQGLAATQQDPDESPAPAEREDHGNGQAEAVADQNASVDDEPAEESPAPADLAATSPGVLPPAATDAAAEAQPHRSQSRSKTGKPSEQTADAGVSAKSAAVTDVDDTPSAFAAPKNAHGVKTADVHTLLTSAHAEDDGSRASSSDTLPRTETLRADGLAHGNTPAARATAAPAPQPGEPRIDVQQLIDRVVGAIRRAHAGSGQLRVRLHPPELGSLQIEVSTRNGVLTARLEVQTVTAHQTLTENLPQLREALAHNVGAVDRIEVQLAENEHDENPSHWSHDDQQSGSGFDREQPESHDDEGDFASTAREDAPAADSGEIPAPAAPMDRLDIEI